MSEEYSLRRHHRTLHKNKFDILEVKLRDDKLQELESDLQGQQNSLLLLLNHIKEQFKEVLLKLFIDCENVNNECSRDTLCPPKAAAL